MTNREAINQISRNKSVFKYDTAMLEALDFAIKALEERPQGEWVLQTHERFNSGNELYKYYCNKCGHKEEHAYSDSKLPNFCENCGADMQKGGAKNEQQETTFDGFLNEQLKDPEFKKERDKLCDEDMRGEK